jgi:hypothetical protein
MKNFGKSGIILLSAALVIAALLISCPSPVGGGLGDGGGFQPAPGMGGVRFVIGTPDTSRTIYPVFSGGNAIQSYRFVFTDSTSTALPAIDDVTTSTYNFSLPPETYTYKIYGFKTATSVGENIADAVAYYDSGATTINVVAGVVNPTAVSVTLDAYFTTGNGTFTYTLNGLTGVGAISNLVSASMTIDAGVPEVLGTPYSNGLSPQTLAAGSHTVDFTVVNGTKSLSFKHALSIYANLNSAFSFTYADAYFGVTPGGGSIVITDPNTGGELMAFMDGATPVPAGATVAVAIGGNKTITLSNAASYNPTPGITYQINTDAVQTLGTPFEIVIDNTGTPDIDSTSAGLYIIQVFGVTNTGAVNQSTYFFVNVS